MVNIFVVFKIGPHFIINVIQTKERTVDNV